MDDTRQDVFETLFRAGAIRSVRVSMLNGMAVISFVTTDGVEGNIYTKRGQVKKYRIETALRTLRAVGMAAVEVDMKGWSLDAVGLF